MCGLGVEILVGGFFVYVFIFVRHSFIFYPNLNWFAWIGVEFYPLFDAFIQLSTKVIVDPIYPFM